MRAKSAARRCATCTSLVLWACRPVVASVDAPNAVAEAGPLGGHGAAVLEPVPEPRRPASTRRLVFSCVTPGLVTFSDRPCGPEAVTLEVKLLHRPDAERPGEAAAVRSPPPPGSTRDKTDDPAARALVAEARERSVTRQEHARTCQRLQDAVLALDRRMRAGYSAAEAPRLWDRWRDAKEQLRQADC
jgi:hypothetical protein